MKKVFSVDVSKIDIEEVNSKDFMKLKIYAISDKENRNNSEFLYEGFEESIKTMYNKPILAYYNSDLQDTESHNSRLNIDDEGIYSDYQYDGGERPVGVIPESANIYVEEIDDKNWIVIDGCIIWTEYNRQLYKLIKKQLKKKVSVEVEVLDYYEEDGIDKYRAWKFLGITILGRNPEDGSIVEEGIEGAHLQLADVVDSPTFNKYMSKLSFAIDDKKSILAKYGIEMKRVNNMETYNDLRCELRKYIEQFLIEDEEDCYYYKYYIEDFLIDEDAAILYDCEDNKWYKLPYSIDDDGNVSVDITNIVELEKVFVEKYSLTEKSKKYLNKKENKGLFVSKKEENMDKFIEAAENAGYVCLGLLNGELKFAKKFSIEGEDIVEIEKVDIFSIEKEKCEEDFNEENLKLDEKVVEEKDDGDDDDDDKEPEDDDDDDDDGAKEEEAIKFEELVAEKEALSEELATVKEELNKFKKDAFEKETDAILDGEEDLDEEIKSEMVEMRNEAKFETVEDFVKELCYKQYVRKPKKDESKKLDFSTSKPSKPVEVHTKTRRERLEEI